MEATQRTLTLILALGAIVASVYYVIEIVKFLYSWYSTLKKVGAQILADDDLLNAPLKAEIEKLLKK